MSRIEVKFEGNVTRLIIRGAFDESLKLPEELKCKTVIIDMNEMTAFNSMGVRMWLNWTKSKKGFSEMRLENCRPNFMKQATFVKEIVPTYAQVDSFYVPYYEPDTQEQVDVKFTFGKEYDQTELRLPQPLHNGKELKLDVEDNYFGFIGKKR